MKRLFICVVCILFVHQTYTSKLTLEQFRENLESKYSNKYLNQKLSEHRGKLLFKLIAEQQVDIFTEDPVSLREIEISLINKARNDRAQIPVVISLMMCYKWTKSDDESIKKKGALLFQDTLQEAETNGVKDIYSFDTAKVSGD